MIKSIEKSYETFIMYLLFTVPGRRSYELKPNGQQHSNGKEILNKNSGGDYPKKMIFFCIGSLYNILIIKII